MQRVAAYCQPGLARGSLQVSHGENNLLMDHVLSLLLLGVLGVSAQTFTCSVTNNPVFCSALGDLYYATNGSRWTVNTGWSSAAAGTPTSYCSFYKTYSTPCNGAGVLTSLCVHLCSPPCSALSLSPPCSMLYNNKLSGTIPPSLGSLTSLQMLYVPTSYRAPPPF